MFLPLAQNKKTLSDMKHRQEETPTHLSCAVAFISHKSALRGEAKKVQEAQLCKKAGAGSSPASRTQSTRIMGSHSPIVKRAMALIAEDVLAQQESGTKQTVWKNPSETETRAGLNIECKNCLCLLWGGDKRNRQVRLFFGTQHCYTPGPKVCSQGVSF